MRVSLFASCLVDQIYPSVGLAVLALLRKLGIDTEFDARQTCCGQPAFNSGYSSESRRVARQFLEVFRDKEAIVVPSGSCATMIKVFLPQLFQDEADMRALSADVGKRTYEFSDFLVSQLGVTDTGAHFPQRVTFHDSCHQLRELGIQEQPRLLLRSVSGIDFVELKDPSRCCGFGGTFAVKFPDVSVAIGSDKVDRILETGADYVVANDVSCLMHLEGLLKRRGSSVRAIHLAEVLAK